MRLLGLRENVGTAYTISTLLRLKVDTVARNITKSTAKNNLYILMLDFDKRQLEISNLPTEQKQKALKILAAVSLLLESEIADPNSTIKGIESDEAFNEGPYKITTQKTAYGSYVVVENLVESMMRLEMLGGALIGVAGMVESDVIYWERIHCFDHDLNDLNDSIFFEI